MLNQIYSLEKNICELYSKFAKDDNIFTKILDIRKQGIKLIEKIAMDENFMLKKPEILPFLHTDNMQNALIIAINAELYLINDYENLSKQVQNEFHKDLIFRLWATSNNEYILALKQALKDEFTLDVSQNNPENLLASFEEFQKDLNHILSSESKNVDLIKMLNSPNFSFFSGAAIGALSGVLINDFIKKENEK